MKLGKKIGKTRYIHAFLLSRLPKEEFSLVVHTMNFIPAGFIPDVIKINMYTETVSFLSYPNFFEEEFPKLKASWTVKWEKYPTTSKQKRRDYNPDNPPIIHRKELMYPHPPKEWIKLTEALEKVGAFEDVRSIGYLKKWQDRLSSLGVFVDKYKVKTK